MRNEFDFFEIEKVHLKGHKTFPFQLYIYNPLHKKFSLVLNSNRPLTKELDQFINFLLDRGGKLAVLKKQKKTFLNAQETLESDIPSLKSRELHELEKEYIMYVKLREIYEEKNGQFAFQSEFEKAISNDNFDSIIERARVEILTFKVTESPTVSLAIHLAKKFLVKDNFLNRIVATSYHLAKTLNIVDQNTLGDIVTGAYLLHLGHTQLSLSSVRKPFLTLSDSEKKLYRKHTILAHHLIKRGNLNLSENCKKIILDHHERINGNGYPNEKYGESIDMATLLVGAVTHLFEFSSGKISGNKQPIRSVIFSIKNKAFIPGLELDFSDKIIEGIINLINTEKEVKNKAA